MARPSDKEDFIVAKMRNRIIAGEIAAGSKIPSYNDLMKEFGVSTRTIHKAIKRLKDEGFLCGMERKGVFVAELLPNRNRIALVLPSPPQFNHFSACLDYCAGEYAAASGREFSIFHNLHNAFYKQSDADRLFSEITSNMIAGIIWCFNPADCPCQEILSADLPIIVSSSGVGDEYKGYKVEWDAATYASSMLHWLRERGVQSIAMLSYPTRNYLMRATQKLLDDYEISTRSEWQISTHDAAVTEPVVRLIMSEDNNNKPDGIVLFDDHLMDGVARALVAKGVRVPQDVRVFSYCNILMPPSCPFPVKLMGFDSRDVIRITVKAIDDCLAGQVPEDLKISPSSVDELDIEAFPLFMRKTHEKIIY